MIRTVDDNIRKLTKVGGDSYAVVVPKTMIRDLGWKEHQKLKVVRKAKVVLIMDA